MLNNNLLVALSEMGLASDVVVIGPDGVEVPIRSVVRVPENDHVAVIPEWPKKPEAKPEVAHSDQPAKAN